MADKSETSSKETKIKANAWALLPMLVFIVIYVTLFVAVSNIPILSMYFSSAPIVPSFVVALIVALLQTRKYKFQDKLGIVGKGIGNSSIIYMIIIFIMAGLFAGTVGRSSASSVAYFMLNFVPPQFAVIIIFIVSCLVSLAMGTSVGAITLITPIAISIANASDQNLALCVSCAICGSMFGDNLSMISDTTIAACTGLGCEMRDKFLENSKIVFPAAILTIALIVVFSIGAGNGQQINEEYNLIEFIPYVLVLILSLCGLNVCLVLGIGIASGICIMLVFSGCDISSLIESMAAGISGMYEIIVITILVASISELIKVNGGFEFILEFIKKHCKTKKVAQFSAGIMVGLIDTITANNTVAIVVSVPIAKEICRYYHVRRRRMASVLDTFSCVVQGILPYGAQMMVAVMLCNEAGCPINAIEIIPWCWYQFILCAIVIFFIVTGLSDKMPTWAKSNKSSEKDK